MSQEINPNLGLTMARQFGITIMNDEADKLVALFRKAYADGAAAEREEFAIHAVDIARRAIREEREACAKVAEDHQRSYYDSHGNRIADKIRARGQQ